MPKIVGQDGTLYDLSETQAEQYYGIGDFATKQNFLRQLSGGSPDGSSSGGGLVPGGALVSGNSLAPTRPVANALGGGSLVPGGALAAGNQLAPYSPKAMMDWEQAKKLILKYESMGQNIPNYRFDSRHTAQGYYQITNSTWRDTAGKIGVDLNQYPTAMSAPADVQEAVARKLYFDHGFAPWAPFNPALARAIGAGENPDIKPDVAQGATTPTPVPAIPQTGNALSVGALSGLENSPWTRLLMLSSMFQSAQQAPPLVKYDPRVGMTTIEPRLQQRAESETGQLPSTTRVPLAPGPSIPSPRPTQLPALPSVPQTPSYVTRTGMRDYWTLPQALELATAGGTSNV